MLHRLSKGVQCIEGPSPGQWSPMPVTVKRTMDVSSGTIAQSLAFPNPDANGKGFNILPGAVIGPR